MPKLTSILFSEMNPPITYLNDMVASHFYKISKS